MNFREYVENEEVKKIDNEINEDVATFIGSALGGITAATAVAFGGALLVLGGLKAAKAGKNLFQRIKGAIKDLRSPKEVLDKIKSDPKVVQAKAQVEERKREFHEQLGLVYAAIDAKDFDLAKGEFSKVEKSVQNMPDVHKAIIAELTRSLKEPPLYVVSPGNKTYQMVKKIINIRVARAAAKATEMAFEKASGTESKPQE